ncbi:cathepsin L [Trichonephila clavata]|uniref:Cathepsin L n=1 Tax=Trichonephila clavata TaxID=2740835 RepID=A0A8X6KU25_TRICU|nr:cathepsin L [Trichonephila clavata]
MTKILVNMIRPLYTTHFCRDLTIRFGVQLFVNISSIFSQVNHEVPCPVCSLRCGSIETHAVRPRAQRTLGKLQEIFRKTLRRKGRSCQTKGLNEYSDLEHNEFVRIFNGYRRQANSKSNASSWVPLSNVQIPDKVDWRDKGLVTPVKNQEQCGSCWAFSTTGSLEGQHMKKTGDLVSLSEQNLVDCSGPEGNAGCEGGLMDQAFEYIKKNKGIDTEASYPYTAEDGSCHFKKSDVGATVTGYVDIPTGDEEALKQAVATVGPISVAIDASHDSFQSYQDGIYDEPECSSEELDHGVLAVGYGTEDGSDYWLVKNSWGKTWGTKGYIKMARNKDNQCGIATQASYPLV